MITHIHHYQEKIERNKKSSSTCEIRLGSDEKNIEFFADYFTQYTRGGSDENTVRFTHRLIIDKSNGDISVDYTIKNHRLLSNTLKSGNWSKKNNFNMLCDFTERAFYLGEKRKNYWGVKFERIKIDVFKIIKEELFDNIGDSFIKNKDYETSVNSVMSFSLFDLIVDFHLVKKNIKFHDGVYYHILEDYPKKKYLKLNDNKFLSAVLDQYKIKSKYLIGELSDRKNSRVNIKCLSWLCGLFGENHVEYIKRFDWRHMCSVIFHPRKQFICKNEKEKDTISKVLCKWLEDSERLDSPFESLYNLFSLRNYLEERGYDLKLKIRTADDIDYLISEWELIKKHLSIGYKLRYDIPEQIISSIEEPIVIDDKTFEAKVLLSEDDFILEGTKMKNCMSKQFLHGALYIYVALMYRNRRINMQFRKGNLVQAYGRANSPVKKEIFSEAMDILSLRISKFPFLIWKKEKYEIIGN